MLQLSVDAIGTRWLSWGEAWLLFVEITRHEGSHVVSSLLKRGYVPHPAGEAAYEIALAQANGRRGAVKQRRRPWDDAIVPLDIVASMGTTKISPESEARRRALDERYGKAPD